MKVIMFQYLNKTRFWGVYKNMISRCTNERHPNYKYYGGRGIKVSREWQQYSNFEMDMYEEYGYWLENNYDKVRNTDLTLDRIDNNGNYCKENCRWITQHEQYKTRRNNGRRKLQTLIA